MMQSANLPLTRDAVLVGGGHAHALVLKRWGMNPLPGAQLTLVTPTPTAPYTGMLPGHIAGHYAREALEIDLVRLARHSGARLILAEATGIDLAARRLHLRDRPPLAYDVLSLDIGISAGLPDLLGFSEYAVAVKPLDKFAEAWAKYLDAVQAGRAEARIVVIGAGLGGVELALAMDFRLRSIRVAASSITVIEASPHPMPDVGTGARRRLLRHLAEQGVALVTGARVTRIHADGVTLSDGRRISAGLVLSAAGAHPHGWLAKTGLHLTDGFVTVDAQLRAITEPAVFAVGDCAHLQASPRPKAGVFAVRQAPILFDNLRAALGAGRMRPFIPQRDYLKLVSLGGRRALADKHGLALQGRTLWWLKDRIDRRFMGQLNEPPPAPAQRLPRDFAAGLSEELSLQKPLCAGCGAKIGADALRVALSNLPTFERDDLVTGPGDDAAVLRHGKMLQVLTTDHLRAFTDDAWLMARIAAIHALGDVWAMGATPQMALASITLPRMSPNLQARRLTEIMQAAGAVFAAEGAAIGGGHSAMGAEFTLGFTVTGLAGERVIGKGGAHPGDALILTKRLGTGTILAAEMARAAPPHAVANAWASMATPQGTAARLLAPHAHAMTDVTGFGLAGHLMEMLDACCAGAQIDLAAVPLLVGAVDLARAGHASSLAPANRAALSGRIAMPQDDPRTALLFDPQTAGGLLAAVPQSQVASLLHHLHQAGFAHAARIGTLSAGKPSILVQ